MKVRTTVLHQITTLCGTFILSSSALAIGPEVIYTEIVTSPTSVAPGMVDLAGNPVVGRFTALFDLNLNWTGNQWALRADTDLDTTFDQVVLLGNGLNGSAFLQDGRPVPGSTTGELWDFFDAKPISWDEKDNIGYSARARPSTNIKEKIVRVENEVHTVLYTESSPTTGLVDVPANPQGDELIGNSVGSVQLRNDGQIFFANTPIQNCSSLRYPAVFLNNAGFAQSGVTHLAPPNDNEI